MKSEVIQVLQSIYTAWRLEFIYTFWLLVDGAFEHVKGVQ